MARNHLDRKGQERKNAANIILANEARERKLAAIKSASDFQRKINYYEYSDTNNHSVRPKGVRNLVNLYFTLSAADQQEALELIKELQA